MKKVGKKIKKGHSEDIEDIIIEDTDDFGGNEIKKLREKLKKCIAEKQEYLDGWQRTKADFVNARKKDEEIRAGLGAFVKEGLITDLLSSIDNFDMAYADKDIWESVDKNWRVGIEHIHTQLLKTLSEHGLEQFDPIGEQFDPIRHDSVESVVTDKEKDDNKITEVMQKGYILNNKIIRPAKVKVAEYKN